LPGLKPIGFACGWVEPCFRMQGWFVAVPWLGSREAGDARPAVGAEVAGAR